MCFIPFHLLHLHVCQVMWLINPEPTECLAVPLLCSMGLINDCALLLCLRYWLGPREDKSDPVIKQDLGSLRLRVCHSQDYVFPSSFYDPLRETILGMGDGQVYTIMYCYLLAHVN